MSIGTKWNYQIHGARGAPALLFLHGFMGAASDWQEVVKQLVCDCFCICPDLPGHGATPLPDNDAAAFEMVANGTVELMDALELARVILIGYSMGGRIALYTALKSPDRVAGLVLESASPGLEDPAQRVTRLKLDEERARQLEERGLAEFVEEWYQSPLFDSLKRFPEKLAALKESRADHNQHDLARALRGLSVGRQPSLWGELSQLQLPVMLISGALDDKYTKVSHRISDMISDCRRRVIDDAGHNTHLEYPFAFASLLREFVTTIPSEILNK